MEKELKELEMRIIRLENIALYNNEKNKPNAVQGFTLGFSIATIIFIIVKQFF